MTEKYTVYEYRTGDELEGLPTDELIEACLIAPQGAVWAIRRGGVWHPVDEFEPHDQVVYVL